jgi:hypothetical protein
MSEDPKTDPQPQETPTHDVPVYPERDPPPETEQPIKAAEGPSERERHEEGHGQGDAPKEGDEDVDEDDLDPQVPHSPPDAKKGRIVFDENKVAG